MAYFNKHGLLNAKSTDDVSENTVLFTAEYILLLEERGLPYEELLEKWCKYVDSCCIQDGLYRPPTEVSDVYMSHDSLTGIVTLSHKFGLDYHTKIWGYLKSHWGTYDNITGKVNFKRFYHPRDLLYYGRCSGNLICKMLYPILFLIMVVSSLQSYKIRGGNKIIKTDGKILNWVRCKGSNLNLTFKVLTLIISKNSYFQSWKNIFKIYFDESHPINKLIERDISSL